MGRGFRSWAAHPVKKIIPVGLLPPPVYSICPKDVLPVSFLDWFQSTKSCTLHSSLYQFKKWISTQIHFKKLSYSVNTEFPIILKIINILQLWSLTLCYCELEEYMAVWKQLFLFSLPRILLLFVRRNLSINIIYEIHVWGGVCVWMFAVRPRKKETLFYGQTDLPSRVGWSVGTYFSSF